MNYLQFTDFRNNSKEYFDQVEHGSTFVIIRKGKPVAKIIPFNIPVAGWKRNHTKIKLKNGITTLELIQKDRNAEGHFSLATCPA